MVRKNWTMSGCQEGSYLETGSGPLLLLIHGGGSRALHYSGIMEQLSDRARLVAPDLRGFGRSGVPKGASISFDTWVSDLATLVAHLGVAEVRLCGWSLGASLAMLLAARQSAHVSRIALLGAPRPDRPINRAFFERRLELLATLPDRGRIVDELLPSIAQMLSPQSPGHAAILETIRDEQLENLDYAEEVTRAYLTRPDLAPVASRLAAPVTLIVGEQDHTCDLAGAGRLAALIADGTIRTVPDCGHYYALEQPAAVSHLIAEALLD